jgi:hypothetical protein
VNKIPAVPAFTSPRLIDDLLAPWQEALGTALPAYRNHAHRIFHLSRAFHQQASAESDRQIAVAAVFHDLGIWSHGTFDYLEPSADLATAWLEQEGHAGSVDMVRAMILDHHRIRQVTPDLVEAFRRADWTDVSQGHLRFGLERSLYQALKAQYPYLGFHALLVRLTGKQLREHPRNPLPMLRW